MSAVPAASVAVGGNAIGSGSASPAAPNKRSIVGPRRSGDWVKISVGGTSTCEDDTLKIVNRGGAAFTSSFDVVPNGGFDISNARTVSFARTPAAGELWTVRVDGINYVADTDTVGLTVNAVVTHIAGLITVGADWLATVDGDTLIVLSRSGESFTLVPCLNAEPAWIEVLAKLTGAFASESIRQF